MVTRSRHRRDCEVSVVTVVDGVFFLSYRQFRWAGMCVLSLSQPRCRELGVDGGVVTDSVRTGFPSEKERAVVRKLMSFINQRDHFGLVSAVKCFHIPDSGH